MTDELMNLEKAEEYVRNACVYIQHRSLYALHLLHNTFGTRIGKKVYFSKEELDMYISAKKIYVQRQDARDILGVSENSFSYYVKRGIPRIRFCGKYYYDQNDIVRWKKENIRSKAKK